MSAKRVPARAGHSVPGHEGQGNIQLNAREKSTKNENGMKHWFFTLDAKEMGEHELQTILGQMCQRFIFQLEKGEETGYLHYQGTLELTRKKRKQTLIKQINPRIFLRPTIDTDAAINYCSKSETRVKGPWSKGHQKPIKIIETLHPWQQEVENIVKEEPDANTIHWYWESEGGVGKTALAKYLCVKYGAMYVNGKCSDILYAATASESDIYVINVVRDDDNPPYKALEMIKDGLWFSGKYESKMVIRNEPHVIVFANYPPDTCKLSKRRWHVVEITNPGGEPPGAPPRG